MARNPSSDGIRRSVGVLMALWPLQYRRLRRSLTGPVPPTLADDPGEEAHPKLVVEGSDGIAAKRRRDPARRTRQRLSVEIPRHAEDVRHGPEIDRRPLGRFHVEARLRVEPGPADTAPVEPAAEVRLVEARGRNDVVHDHL